MNYIQNYVQVWGLLCTLNWAGGRVWPAYNVQGFSKTVPEGAWLTELSAKHPRKALNESTDACRRFGSQARRRGDHGEPSPSGTRCRLYPDGGSP